MVETQKAIELSVQDYIASLGLNPDRVKYKKTASNNISTTSAQWSFKAPDPRALLLSCGWINWKPTITKYRLDGTTAAAFVNNGVRASWKPCLPFANAMSNIQLQINGASISMSQPRRFMSVLSMMFAGREGAKKAFETAGGGFPDYNGWSVNADGGRGRYGSRVPVVAVAGNNVTIDGGPNLPFTAAAMTVAQFVPILNQFSAKLTGGHAVIDRALFDKQQRFMHQLFTTDAFAGADPVSLNALNTMAINCFEPILAPPFNPYFYLKKNMPDYCWFKHMSPMIPHVREIELQINFQNLSAGAILTEYLNAAANEIPRLKISALAADMHLWWYIPPLNTQLPRQIPLQTWHVREFVTDIVAGANNIITAGITTPLIELMNVPSLIVIHGEVDKDTAASYDDYSLTTDNDFLGGAQHLSPNRNALDSFLEIRNLQVDLGAVSQVIGTHFTQEELYHLTKKNSKYLDFPWSYDVWRGSLFGSPDLVALRYNQPSRCFIALRPKDLAEKFGAGVKYPMQIQFTMDVIRRDGLNGIPGGAKRHKLYVHAFFGKHFMSITPDSASYQRQNIDLNVALQQHRIPASVQTGGNVKLDDSRYQSRASNI